MRVAPRRRARAAGSGVVRSWAIALYINTADRVELGDWGAPRLRAGAFVDAS